MTDKHTEPSHYFKPVTKRDIEKVNPFQMLQHSSMGIYIAIPILLGLTIGIFLDNLFRVRPMFTLVLLFFGTVGSFYNIYRIFKENDGTHRASD